MTQFFVTAFALVWLIVDTFPVKNDVYNFIRDGFAHYLFAKPTYAAFMIIVAYKIYVFLKKALNFSSELINEMHESYTTFIIEGPKKKKKNEVNDWVEDINNWVDANEHRNPLDYPGAAEYYFDKDGNFDEKRFDIDLQQQLNKGLEESNRPNT